MLRMLMSSVFIQMKSRWNPERKYKMKEIFTLFTSTVYRILYSLNDSLPIMMYPNIIFTVTGTVQVQYSSTVWSAVQTSVDFFFSLERVVPILVLTLSTRALERVPFSVGWKTSFGHGASAVCRSPFSVKNYRQLPVSWSIAVVLLLAFILE